MHKLFSKKYKTLSVKNTNGFEAKKKNMFLFRKDSSSWTGPGFLDSHWTGPGFVDSHWQVWIQSCSETLHGLVLKLIILQDDDRFLHHSVEEFKKYVRSSKKPTWFHNIWLLSDNAEKEHISRLPRLEFGNNRCPNYSQKSCIRLKFKKAEEQ